MPTRRPEIFHARRKHTVMPRRGMSRTTLIPGVSLRSTPGYSIYAAPRLGGKGSACARDWRPRFATFVAPCE